ncbi:MAG TPA: HAMP domain-containing sensor histidine kinase [Streptosporangiaceae bacterium]|nr:HAMP domain-containing sensor histidine kinase [Streptosporangiaceae bacterium]
MTTTSRLSRWQGHLGWPSGRAPLRVKMITALLALVAIALAIISVASLTVFRNYLQDRADGQLYSFINQASRGYVGQGPGQQAFILPGYVVEFRDSQGHLLQGTGNWQQLNVPGPSVPTSKSWISANNGRVVTVPALTGGDNWRVVAEPVTYQTRNLLTGQLTSHNGTVVVGVDLGNIDQTITWLSHIDLIVSVIIIVGLAIVGVAVVRASLRPLADIEKTARAIAAGDLSRRVPDQDPHTEVGQLGRSLNTMLAQIETSFDARTQSEAAARRSEERMRQFVADASHELRTPLTAMRGYAEYYRQRGGMHDDPAGRGQPGNGEAGHDLGSHSQLTRADMDRIMQRVEQESARMGVLVEDMLLLARLDQQRPIEHRPVDLLTLAADAVQDARIIAPDREITLDVGSGAAFLILGDEVRLRQVIGNLMNNALTHTPEGTPVAVRVLAGPRQPVPSVVLEVADQGQGLHQDQAEHVFERFYRADQARTRKAGGTGLGLAIVAALVAAHDGTVALKTAPGQGATFRITLPLAPEAQGDQLDESDQPGQASPAEATTAPGERAGPDA